MHIREELQITKPLQPGHEVALALLLTREYVARLFEEGLGKPEGISDQQYNVLRILRGSQPQGLTCSAIGDRMITAEPDITRLLGRLKAQKLVRQQRDKRDKRVLWTQISPAGLALLAEMDPVVQQAPGELLGHLTYEELAQLIRLVESARSRCGDRQAPVNCDGANRAAGESCPSGQAPAITQ